MMREKVDVVLANESIFYTILILKTVGDKKKI